MAIASKTSQCRVLLTFTGFHDPFASSVVTGNEQEGPVLSLVRLWEFDHVVLFSTPNMEKNTTDTEREIQSRHPGITAAIRKLSLSDPTDYFQILSELRKAFAGISAQFPNGQFFIGTASGTPQMHSCWVMLAASGEIPARLLQARNVKFVTSERPSVTEIDTTHADFPIVRTTAWVRVQGDDAPDATAVIRELGIIGDDPGMAAALQRAANIAPYDVPVLILGESGTGKEKIATVIHRLSRRSAQPLISLNCAAIPSQLAESHLFGHKKGAFTGATADHKGVFERADNGTIFLDELAELSPEVQTKLLRTLQEGIIEPVGRAQLRVNCRIIAATNADLDSQMQAGRFRKDLFHRLNATDVRLPPLRERPADIPKLAQHFLDRMNDQYKKPRRFSPEALAAMQRHLWPGNVRELSNIVQDAAIHAIGGIIQVEHLRLPKPTAEQLLGNLPEPREGFSLDDFIKSIRGRLHTRAMELAGGNSTRAARLLGVSPQAVAKFHRTR